MPDFLCDNVTVNPNSRNPVIQKQLRDYAAFFEDFIGIHADKKTPPVFMIGGVF